MKQGLYVCGMGDQASERNETQRNAMQYNVTALSGRTGAIGEGEKVYFAVWPC